MDPPADLGVGSLDNAMGYDYGRDGDKVLDVVVCPSADRTWGRWHSMYPQTRPLKPLQKFNNPSKFALRVEGRPYTDTFSPWNKGNGYIAGKGMVAPWAFFREDCSSYESPMKPFMHGNGMNVVYSDGHVGFKPYQVIMPLTEVAIVRYNYSPRIIFWHDTDQVW